MVLDGVFGLVHHDHHKQYIGTPAQQSITLGFNIDGGRVNGRENMKKTWKKKPGNQTWPRNIPEINEVFVAEKIIELNEELLFNSMAILGT